MAHKWASAIALLLLTAGCSTGAPSGAKSPTGPSNPDTTKSSDVNNVDHHGKSTVQKDGDIAENPAPLLTFRPDALVMVSFGRNSQEVYGYNLATQRLEPVTTGARPDFPSKAVFSLATSSDGELFAYVRGNGLESNYGVCVRSVRGGEAQCAWEELGDRVAWLPGTHEVWVTGGGRGETWAVFELVGGKLTKKNGVSLPNGNLYSISPDGGFYVYADGKGKWLGKVGRSPSAPQKAKDVGPWLDSTHMVVLTKEQIGILETTGLFQELPKPVVEGGEVLSSLQLSPSGRYVGISFGLPGAVFKYSGETALFDLQTNTWRRTKGTIRGWTGDGRFCVVASAGGFSLMSPVSLEQVPIGQGINGAFVSASPDGDWLVFEAEDTYALYQISTGQAHQIKADRGTPVSFIWVPSATN